MKNPFLREVDIFFGRIVELQSTSFQINNVLKNDLKRFKEIDKKNKKPEYKSFSRLVISDLSGPTDNGWEINFSTDYDRRIKWEEYEKEIANLVSRESGYVVAQSCEAFVRFLKNATAIQLFLNKGRAISLDNKFKKCETKADFKKQVRKSNKLRSPEELFKELSYSCKLFENMCKNNNLEMDLNDFYQVLAFARHKITHSSSRFNKAELSNWSRGKIAIFKKYFPIEDVDNEWQIKMSKHQSGRILKRTAELGLVIFKSLSICNNFDWEMIKK